MKKFIFLFAFCITVTNIFAQTDPNQIKKEGNDAFNAKNYPVAYAKFSEYLKQTNNQDSATAQRYETSKNQQIKLKSK